MKIDARRLQELVALRGAGPLTILPLPAAVPGDVGRLLLLSSGRAVGALVDLLHMRHLLVQRPAALEGLQAQAGEDAWADALAAACREKPAVGALEVARLMLDTLQHELPVEGGRWRLTTSGEWDRRGSGAGVELGGEKDVDLPGAFRAVQRDGGVEVYVHEAGIAAPLHSRSYSTMNAWSAAQPGLLEILRRSVAAREAFRRRTFTARAAAAWLAEALDGAAPGALSLRSHDGSYPYSWPTAAVLRTGPVGEHPCVSLAESAEGLRVAAGRWTRVYATLAALQAAVDEIRTAVVDESRRLTPDKLKEHREYRVLKAFGTFKEGARIRYTGRSRDEREDGTTYHFEAANKETCDSLSDGMTKDLEILDSLHDYLK